MREFYDKRNKIVIIRGVGGLGDIFMHRMMFEDFKELMPECELTFACPMQYHDAVKDHPLIDKVVDCAKLDRTQYMVSYDTTTACGRYEMRIAPLADKNRSDIWANHCGVELKKHEMHIRFLPGELDKGREIIESKRDRPGPSVAVCPISAMQQKNLQDTQLLPLIAGLRDRGMYAFGLHTAPIFPMIKNDIPCLNNLKIRQWMAVLNQVDYIVSVDTSAFHCAGGMKKPVVGAFTFAASEAYGKHYPRAELLQGPCPVGHKGCYNWGLCPVKDFLKPCLTGITPEMILAKVDRMVEKNPIYNHGTEHSSTTDNHQGCSP